MTHEAIVEAFHRKKILKPCPMCSVGNWDIGDKIALHATYNPADRSVNPASGLPSISLICTNCGFIAHYHPSVLGLDVNSATDR